MSVGQHRICFHHSRENYLDCFGTRTKNNNKGTKIIRRERKQQGNKRKFGKIWCCSAWYMYIKKTCHTLNFSPKYHATNNKIIIIKNTVPMEEHLSCMDIIPAGERERKQIRVQCNISSVTKMKRN